MEHFVRLGRAKQGGLCMQRRWSKSLGVLLALLLCSHPAIAAYMPSQAQRLVVYTAHKEDVYTPIIREFENRTGIWVTVVAGSTAEMLERISFEADAPVCDVMFGGGVESLEAYQAYFSDPPADLSQLIDSRYVVPDSRWLPFSALPVVLIYNPRLVGSRPPLGWINLLDGRFSGRIAFADPVVSGSSYTALLTLLTVLPEADTLPRFVRALRGRVLSGSGDVVEAVANGTCTVGITLEETAMKAIVSSMDIAMTYPEEGTTVVPDGAAIITGCPHPANAELFMRFILSKDVQTYLITEMYRRPVRADIPLIAPFVQNFSRIGYDIRLMGTQKAEQLRDWADALREGAAP